MSTNPRPYEGERDFGCLEAWAVDIAEELVWARVVLADGSDPIQGHPMFRAAIKAGCSPMRLALAVRQALVQMAAEPS